LPGDEESAISSAVAYRNAGCGGLYWTVNPARRPSIPNVSIVASRVV
jgi:hypothetical protein